MSAGETGDACVAERAGRASRARVCGGALGYARRARARPRAGERAQGKEAAGKGCWVGLPAGLGRLQGKREWAGAGGKGESGLGWEAGPRGWMLGCFPGLGWVLSFPTLFYF